MGKLQRTLTAAVALVVASLPGCVELTGQRITLKYDEAADRLVLFLAYDGIHDDEGNAGKQEAEDLRTFVQGGDVMFLDWFGHVEWQEIRTTAQDTEARPAQRELARLTVETIQAQAVGHYRDPGGRIGALQRIVIPAASAYVRQVNTAIDEAVVAHADRDAGYAKLRKRAPRTLARIEAAARSGHRWFTLDGSAIRLSFPVHAREWARVKADLLEGVFDLYDEAKDEGSDENVRPKWFVQLLAAGPLSLDEFDGNVTITFGDKSHRTSRFALRDAYDSSMEQLVKKHVPTRLDDVLAAHLLDARPDPSPGALADLLRWGPAEDRVRAVLAVAVAGDADDRQSADAWLARFAIGWNKDEGYPLAPTSPADHDLWVEAWTKWYGRMLLFPLEP